MKKSTFKKKIAMITTSLVVAAGVVAPPLSYVEAVPKSAQKQKSNVREVDPNFDIANGWRVLEFSTEAAGVKVEDLFLQNRMVEDSATNLKLNSVFTNFANVRNTKLKAVRKFDLKKNRTYKIKWRYGLFTNSSKGYTSTASIDFNGHKVTKSDTFRDTYADTVITGDKNKEYVVTIEYFAPPRTNVYAMVGQDLNDAEGGIIEESTPLPVVEEAEAGDSSLRGTGVKGNQIIVTDDEGRSLGNGVVEEDNTFVVGLERKLVYNETIQIFQKDERGNQSDPVRIRINDTIAPVKPTMDAPIEFTDQLVKGVTEKNARVEVRTGTGKLVGTGVANGTQVPNENLGRFNFKLSQETAVDTPLFVTAMDEAGNRSEAVETVVVDNSKPEAPVVDEITDQNNVLTGKGNKVGSKIKAMINNQRFEAEVKEDKTFQIDLKRTFPGGTVINVTETDKKGNESETTRAVVKGTIKTETPKVNEVSNQDKTVTGTSEPNAHIQILIGGDLYEGRANEEGQFTVEMNRAYPKDTGGSVTAKGASDILSDPAAFVVTDRTAPDKPALNSVKDKDTTVTGKSEANAEVRIEFRNANGKSDFYTAKADANGDFTIDLDHSYPAKTPISAVAKDTEGNKSQPTQSRVLSSVNLEIAFDEVTNHDNVLKGTTSRPNTHYEITIGHRTYEGFSDENGAITVDLDRFYSIGTEVSYTASDDGENTPSQSTFVYPTPPAEFAVGVGDESLDSVAEPNAKVTVKVNGQNEQVVNANEKGEYHVDFSAPLKMGDVVSVTQEVKNLVSGETTILAL